MADKQAPTGSKRPASRLVADDLREQIEQGLYEPGSQLPSYRQLVAERGIALNTAREAIRLLERDGLAVIRHGSGVFVRAPGEPISVEAQLRSVQVEVEGLRRDLRRGIDDFAAMERRVADIADRLRKLVP